MSAHTTYLSAEAQNAGWREDADAHGRSLHFLASEMDKEVVPHPAEKDEDKGHRYSYKNASELRQ